LIDGVIVDTVKAMCKTYNKRFKNHKDFVEAKPENVKGWDGGNQFPLFKDGAIDKMFGESDFWKHLTFIDGHVKSKLKELSELFDITIVSYGYARNMSKKALWIEKNLPFIKDVVLMNGKYLKKQMFMPMNEVNNENINIIIDDNVSNFNIGSEDLNIIFAKYGKNGYNTLDNEKLEEKQLEEGTVTMDSFNYTITVDNWELLYSVLCKIIKIV